MKQTRGDDEMTRFAVASMILILGAHASNGSEAEVRRLRAEVKALRAQVGELQARLGEKPGVATSVDRKEEDKKTLDQALTEEQQKSVDSARTAVNKFAREVRRRMKSTSAFAEPGIKTHVGNWSGASARLVKMLAGLGQERACKSALEEFRLGRSWTEAARLAFERSAYAAATTLMAQWENPDAAMRLAAEHGPKSRHLTADWGRLCERAAAATKKREYKSVALKCYLRAVTIDSRQRAAWARVHALEAELKASR
jgi:hypothetical protein